MKFGTMHLSLDNLIISFSIFLSNSILLLLLLFRSTNIIQIIIIIKVKQIKYILIINKNIILFIKNDYN